MKAEIADSVAVCDAYQYAVSVEPFEKFICILYGYPLSFIGYFARVLIAGLYIYRLTDVCEVGSVCARVYEAR